MVEIDKIKLIHQEFIDWLDNKKDEYSIEDYIKYTKDQLSYYESAIESQDFIFFKEIPRTLNRYLDEFVIDYEFIEEARNYFNKMRETISKM